MLEFGAITIEVIVDAPVSTTWRVLTEPELMRQWMFEEPIEIITDWQVGGPILIKGHIHDIYFENTGKVLQFQPNECLRYEHLSSLSKLPHEPGSYTTLDFKLQAVKDQTLLKISLENFPTESIYKHLKFYWETTLGILKKFAEELPGA